jgi:hypothetical protein
MALDSYAYTAKELGQRTKFYDGAKWDVGTRQFVCATATEPKQLAHWYRHPSLHGYMAKLWLSDKDESVTAEDFNGVELELTWEDLNELGKVIETHRLPKTEGFFFGKPADERYFDKDMEFVTEAKCLAFLGLRVFYYATW